MGDWVLVDTCIWASFFAKPSSPEKAGVNQLLKADRAAIIGSVVTEVLQGFKRDDQANWVASRLRLTHYLFVEWDDWREAARLGRECAAIGHYLPLAELALAAVCYRRHTWLYSTDPHFDLIPGLKRFLPDE